jgi:HlyD family secretion protein
MPMVAMTLLANVPTVPASAAASAPASAAALAPASPAASASAAASAPASAASAASGAGAPRRSLADIVAREKARTRRRRAILWASLAVVPLLAFALWMVFRPRPVPLAAQFRMQPVTQGDVLREVRATGHVEAVTTVLVGAEISGRIATVEVDYNQRVTQGQVLARFDRIALAAQLAQAEAGMAAARSALEQARTDRDHTARELVRVDRLLETKAIADAEHDNATAAARLASQRVAAAEAQVAAQQALATVARTSLDHAVIRAPIDGVVITRNIDPGQTVAAMLQTPVLFTVAADLRKMRVIAAVDEADIGEVAVQQPASFTVNAYPDRVFSGVVTEVRSSPAVVQDVVTYGTIIEVDNLDLALKPGMTASARVRVATAKNVPRAPSAALRFAPPGEKNGDRPGVWVLEGAALRRLEVRPGITDGELTELAPWAIDNGRQVLIELTPEGRKAHGLIH